MKKYLYLTLPSMGKTALCKNSVSNLERNVRIETENRTNVFIDFDLRNSKYISSNIVKVRKANTELLIQMLASKDVLGVTGFVTAFDFKYLFDTVQLITDYDLYIVVVIPTLKRLGQAVYDSFNRVSPILSLRLIGDDPAAFAVYPWSQILSHDLSATKLFPFEYFRMSIKWLDDMIADVKKIINLYLNITQDYKYLINLKIINAPVNVYISDVHFNLFSNPNKIGYVKSKDWLTHDYKGLSDKCTDKFNDDTIRAALSNNDIIMRAALMYYDRYSYVVPCVVDTANQVRMINRYYRYQQLLSDRASDDKYALDLIKPLNDR